MEVKSILMIACAAIGLLSLAFVLVLYIFKGVGMFAISRRRSLGASGLAWIPILSMFKLGQIADDAVLKKRGRRSHFVVLYPVFRIAGSVLSCVSIFITLLSLQITPGMIDALFRGEIEIWRRHAEAAVSDPIFYVGVAIGVIGYILIIIATVFLYMSLFHIYKSCSGKYIVMFILTFIFPFLYPVFLLAIRRNDNPRAYPDGKTSSTPLSYGTEEGGTTYEYHQENM